MTKKRFTIEFDGHQYFLVNDKENERCLARLDTRMDALAWLEIYEMLSEENEQLKNLCKTLIKHIEKKSIAFIIDDEVRELLE